MTSPVPSEHKWRGLFVGLSVGAWVASISSKFDDFEDILEDIAVARRQQDNDGTMWRIIIIVGAVLQSRKKYFAENCRKCEGVEKPTFLIHY